MSLRFNLFSRVFTVCILIFGGISCAEQRCHQIDTLIAAPLSVSTLFFCTGHALIMVEFATSPVTNQNNVTPQRSPFKRETNTRILGILFRFLASEFNPFFFVCVCYVHAWSSLFYFHFPHFVFVFCMYAERHTQSPITSIATCMDMREETQWDVY